ncbi:aldolase [Pyrofollis japonicus]|uniref:class II aldolase/adducin family protein n=1 Tax=Pyrofollis japonicus TaxID=3060460 RepID=UPI00295A9C8E|nr:class II aldolase/adducin family protein [Pyrofollis japonicus]BEP17173.1 aldolase [Pyrofollis japonicus]
MHVPPLYRLREALVDAMKILHYRGLLNIRGGNASAIYRLQDNYAFIYITPSGAVKPKLRPEDIAVIDLNANVYEGKPSSEYRLHLAIYRRRDDVRAIVHAHNPLAVLAERLGLRLDPGLLGVEARYYLGECVAIVPETEPGTEDLAKKTADALARKECSVAILAGHGAVAVGTDNDPEKAVYEAVDKLEVLEDLARSTILYELVAKARQH